MRVAVRVLVIALATVRGGAPCHAQGLPDAAARTSAIRCQNALLKATAHFFAKELAVLAKCNAKALECVHQTDPETKGACLLKGNSCRASLQGILAKADNDLGGLIAESCGALGKDELLGSNGLGYALVDPECLSIGSELVDVTSITGCLRKVYRRSIERLFAIESPRTRELFEVTGVDIGSLPDLPGYPSCDGCSIATDKKTAKNLTACGKSITKAGGAFASAAAVLVSRCAIALFKCEQSPKPLSPAKLEVCRAKAQLQCEKAKAKAAIGKGKVRAKVEAACASLDPALLASQAGVNLGTLACECAAVNVDQVQTLDQYLDCSSLHHECRVAQLLRFAIPRLDELLLNTRTTTKLEDILCALPPEPPAMAHAIISGCRICRLLSAIRGRFRRPFGDIVKFAKLKPGGAKGAVRRAGGEARAVDTLPAITFVDGDRTYAPNRARQINVGYRLGSAGSSASRANDPPTMLIGVERLDGSLVANDAFELELESDVGETELTVAYSPAAPGESGCSFRLVFGVDSGDATEFTPFDLQAGNCEVNGHKDPGEDCDPADPAVTNCDSNCTFRRCGNGVVTTGEQCDDGNLDADDACLPDCGAPTPTPSPTPAQTFEVVNFELTSQRPLQGALIRVDYPVVKGSFPGNASDVDCVMTRGTAQIFTKNDDDAAGRLTLSVASAGPLTFPIEFRCRFDIAAGKTLLASDLPVTVAEVTENSVPGDPNTLDVAVQFGFTQSVNFVATASIPLQAIQFHANYPSAKGTFAGSGAAVACVAGTSATFVKNEIEASSRLNLIVSSVNNLTFPIEIRCVFAPSDLLNGDVVVTVDEVVHDNATGDPNTLSVDVQLGAVG